MLSTRSLLRPRTNGSSCRNMVLADSFWQSPLDTNGLRLSVVLTRQAPNSNASPERKLWFCVRMNKFQCVFTRCAACWDSVRRVECGGHTSDSPCIPSAVWICEAYRNRVRSDRHRLKRLNFHVTECWFVCFFRFP